MAGYTDPNTVVVSPKTMLFNRPQLISPAQAGPTKQHVFYESGPIPYAAPRQRVQATPTSAVEPKGPPLPGRG